jgi:hypothetical protein
MCISELHKPPLPIELLLCQHHRAMRRKSLPNLNMRKRILLTFFLIVLVAGTTGAARAHLVTFGPWIKVHLFLGPEADRVEDMKIRSLNIDGRSREFTLDEPHDVTDRVFVIRRAYRMNDALTSRPDWKWQRDGWLQVDRGSGRVSKVSLPDFDPFYSVVSWFRDYAAYCGVTEGQKLYAVVAQLGQRKPVLRTHIGEAKAGDNPDSECGAPVWQKQPVRVVFQPFSGQKHSFAIHGRSSEPEPAEEQQEPKADKQ